jgi:hypothetical protein
MKKELILVFGLFALLALSMVLVSSEKATATDVQPSFEEAAQGYVVLGTCNYFCSKCVPIGHNGACTSLKACC